VCVCVLIEFLDNYQTTLTDKLRRSRANRADTRRTQSRFCYLVGRASAPVADTDTDCDADHQVGQYLYTSVPSPLKSRPQSPVKLVKFGQTNGQDWQCRQGSSDGTLAHCRNRSGVGICPLALSDVLKIRDCSKKVLPLPIKLVSGD
jgi:hypothetical protein